MNAGKLYERVRFEKPIESVDGYGGFEELWQAQMTVRAYYKRLRGTEAVIASRLEGKQPTVITIRASNATRQITTHWRAIDARTGEIFNIRSIIETDDRAYLDITAESGVAT